MTDLRDRYSDILSQPQAPTSDPIEGFSFSVDETDSALVDEVNAGKELDYDLTELRFRLTELANEVNTALGDLKASEARWRSWKHQPWQFQAGLATILEERTMTSQWKGDVDLAIQRINAKIKVLNESRTPYNEMVTHLQEALDKIYSAEKASVAGSDATTGEFSCKDCETTYQILRSNDE